jgi:hypothetical protein
MAEGSYRIKKGNDIEAACELLNVAIKTLRITHVRKQGIRAGRNTVIHEYR